MNKLRIYLLFAIGLGLVFLFSAKEIFSQDSRNIQLFRPSSQVQQHNKDRRIKQWAEHYKKSYGINSLYTYKAVVLNSPSVCNAAGRPQECRERMEMLMELNSLAIGRCGILEDPDERRICAALKSGDCSGLKSGEKLSCQGLLDLDPEILERSFGSRVTLEDKEDAGREVAFYSAFKNNNVASCMQFLGDDAYVYRLGCRILLSSEPQRIIDGLALDFAYYHYSDSENKKNACNSISDEYIRGYCTKGVSLSRFVDKYFLGN